MKKILLPILMLLAMVGTSKAQTNAFTVADIDLPQNSVAELKVNFQFDADYTYTGYSFNLQLPDDLEFVTKEVERTDPKTKEKIVEVVLDFVKGSCHAEDHSVTANFSEGLVKVAGLSLGSTPLAGTSGVLLTFTVRPKKTLDVGETYTGTIKDILLVPVEGAKQNLAASNFTVTIGEPDDGRIVFNENATNLPTYTAGDKGNVRMNRTISANKWSTIVLPFTLAKAKAETVFGTDVQLAEFSGFEALYSDEDDVTPDAINIQFTTYSMTTKKGMTGGKPFLIKTSKDISQFEADDVTLCREVSNVEKADEYDTKGKYTGTLVKSTIPEDGLFISNEKFWYSTGNTSVKAFRCWFELGAVLDKETDFNARVKLSFTDEDGESTKIDARTMEPIETGKVYNMAGQYVGEGEDMNRLPKGIYIVNGKKVIK